MTLSKKRHIIIFTGYIFFCSCKGLDHEYTTNKNLELTKDGLTKRSPEIIFKTWLRDTIPSILEWEQIPETFILDKEISIRSDSLSMTIEKSYRFYNTDQNAKNLTVTSLLSEYDELPKSKAEISFTDYTYYYPTKSQKAKFDFINEIHDLNVIDGSTVSQYTVISGRLASKSVLNIGAHPEQKTNVEFIWENDSLVKRTIKY